MPYAGVQASPPFTSPTAIHAAAAAGARDLAEQRRHRSVWPRHWRLAARPAARAGAGAAARWVARCCSPPAAPAQSCVAGGKPDHSYEGMAGANQATQERPHACCTAGSADGRCMLRVGMTNPPFILEHLEEIAEILQDHRVFSYLHVPVRSGSPGSARPQGPARTTHWGVCGTLGAVFLTACRPRRDAEPACVPAPPAARRSSLAATRCCWP